MSQNRRYRVRLHWRGDGESPLSEADQPVEWSEAIEGHIGTAADYDPTDGAAPAGGVFWNPQGDGPFWLVGIDPGDRIVPKHGLRVTYEEIP